MLKSRTAYSDIVSLGRRLPVLLRSRTQRHIRTGRGAAHHRLGPRDVYTPIPGPSPMSSVFFILLTPADCHAHMVTTVCWCVVNYMILT